MSITVSHKFHSTKADSPDTTLVNPSNWNDLHNIADTSNILITDDQIFSPQAPGINLTGGITNTITLSPVPLGVNGFDLNHYLYISGGTGAPEAVLINGGSAVSGAVSGTLSFVPAGNHSGAWSIQSATSGIQETVNLMPNTGGIALTTTGNKPIYQTITIGNGGLTNQSAKNNVSLFGVGPGITTTVGNKGGGTVLQWFGPNGGTFFNVNGPIVGIKICNYTFDGAPSSTIAATALLSNHVYEFYYSDLFTMATGGGFAYDFRVKETETAFAAGSSGVAERLFTGGLQTNGSGMNIGGTVYNTGYLDIAQATFRNINLQVGSSGIGLQLGFVDSCNIEFVITMNASIGLNVIQPTGAPNNFPTSMTIKQCYFGGTTSVVLPSGWHPTPVSDVYGGLLFMPWGGEVGPPPLLDGCYGFTDVGEHFNFKFLEKALTLATGANNDVDTGTANFVRISGPTGAYSISGIKHGRPGKILLLVGNTGGALTINNQSSSSAVGNRIQVPGNTDITLSNGTHSAVFIYCGIDGCWYFINGK